MRWRYIVWIAARHLTIRRDRFGLSFMTIVSILGVTIGVAALIVVLSVMGGFEGELQKKMLRGLPHMEVVSEIHATAGFSLKEYSTDRLKKLYPEAYGVEPFTQADVVIKRRKMMLPITLFGIDPSRKEHLWGFSNTMIEGELNSVGTLSTLKSPSEGGSENKLPGLVIGEELASQLGADVGDELTIISPQMINVGTMLGGGTVSKRFVMVGKFRSELSNYDLRWAVTSIKEGRKFLQDYDEVLDTEQYVTGIAVNFRDPMKIRDYVGRLKKQTDLKELKSIDWQEVNKSLIVALKLEKFAMGSILMLIVLVAAFSISGTMMMMVFHKRAQISCLRSLGMSKKDIMKLFLTNGLAIGVIGVVFGLLVGLFLCTIIYFRHDIALPEGVYVLKALPVRFLPLEYGIICITALILIIITAIYPAITAARQDPGVGLRYE